MLGLSLGTMQDVCQVELVLHFVLGAHMIGERMQRRCASKCPNKKGIIARWNIQAKVHKSGISKLLV
jgi:hypothetical protein